MYTSNDVQNQYEPSGLLQDILERLQKQGIDPNEVTRDDLAGVDEFHVRGAAVSKELAHFIGLKEGRALDIGCGLGGPCRMLADEFNLQVTGIDLSETFIRTAVALTELVGLSDRIAYLQGDATDLPLGDQTFDLTWTQHVQMNVADKRRFYGEMARVLKPGGQFLYYDIFQNKEGAINFPVPWANHSGISFLVKAGEMRTILTDLGFSEIQLQDQTAAGIQFFENLLERIQRVGPPALGLNVIMGAETFTKLTNLLSGLRSGILRLQSGVFRKGL